MWQCPHAATYLTVPYNLTLSALLPVVFYAATVFLNKNIWFFRFYKQIFYLM